MKDDVKDPIKKEIIHKKRDLEELQGYWKKTNEEIVGLRRKQAGLDQDIADVRAIIEKLEE